MFFDISMSKWANVMYCSKAKCALVACVSLNIHHAKQYFKKTFPPPHGETFMGKLKFVLNLMSVWLFLTSTNKFILFWLHFVQAFNTNINQNYLREFADKTCMQTYMHSLPIFCAKIK